MNQILIQTFAYLLVFLAAVLVFNFLSNSFLLKFLRVKASRGRKMLVEIRGRLENYYVIGVPEGGWLIFRDKENKRDKNKEPKRIHLPEGATYRKMNVNCVNVDEEKNAVIKPDMRSVAGYDPIKWNGLLKRALFNPVKDKDKLLLILILVGVILLILGLIFVYSKVESVGLLVKGAATVTGGNV